MRRRLIGCLVALMLFATAAWAVTVPHTFQAGTIAIATEVNENFQALVDAVTALESISNPLGTSLSSVTNQITSVDDIQLQMGAGGKVSFRNNVDAEVGFVDEVGNLEAREVVITGTNPSQFQPTAALDPLECNISSHAGRVRMISSDLLAPASVGMFCCLEDNVNGVQWVRGCMP